MSKLRVKFATVLCLVATTAMPVRAQYAGPVPQSDVNCNYGYTDTNVNNMTVPPCSVIGTRNVTLQNVSRNSISSTQDQITSTYNVQFNGTTQLDGYPVITGIPSYDSRDAGQWFLGQQSADVSATYQGVHHEIVASGTPTPDQNVDRASFDTYNNVQTVVNRIDASISSSYLDANNNRYNFTFWTPNPTSITNGNTTAIAGRVYSADFTRGVEFGTISGTATLLSGDLFTPVNGTSISGFKSPFQITYAPTTVITTRLDEFGLMTPQISVTNGINMNGSRVTGLAAGVAPTDAVNKAQLDALAAQVSGSSPNVAINSPGGSASATGTDAIAIGNGASGSGEGSVAIGANAQALANGSVAIGQGAVATVPNSVSFGSPGEERQLTNVADGTSPTDAVNVGQLAAETNARVSADVGFSNRLNDMGSRIDQIEGHMSILDRRVASSTAAAMALSGNTFLPGMKFNLTANVATYDGAYAVALQAGALVSRHVALNAGLATGFNKDGKSGGRVGLTFGW